MTGWKPLNSRLDMCLYMIQKLTFVCSIIVLDLGNQESTHEVIHFIERRQISRIQRHTQVPGQVHIQTHVHSPYRSRNSGIKVRIYMFVLDPTTVGTLSLRLYRYMYNTVL